MLFKLVKKMKNIKFKEITLRLSIFGIVGLVIVGLVIGATVGAEQADEKAIQLLESNGYSNIELLGYDPFAGGEYERHRVRFRAVNSNGHEIEGAVTGDDFKGWTIRLF